MHMARKLEPPGRHHSRERLEGLEADVPLGILLRQLAALRAMLGIDEATAHIIERIADMDLQLPFLVLFLHSPASLAARTAALKSSISCSGFSKR
jgi:hypothetical protein